MIVERGLLDGVSGEGYGLGLWDLRAFAAEYSHAASTIVENSDSMARKQPSSNAGAHRNHHQSKRSSEPKRLGFRKRGLGFLRLGV